MDKWKSRLGMRWAALVVVVFVHSAGVGGLYESAWGFSDDFEDGVIDIGTTYDTANNGSGFSVVESGGVVSLQPQVGYYGQLRLKSEQILTTDTVSCEMLHTGTSSSSDYMALKVYSDDGGDAKYVEIVVKENGANHQMVANLVGYIDGKPAGINRSQMIHTFTDGFTNRWFRLRIGLRPYGAECKVYDVAGGGQLGSTVTFEGLNTAWNAWNTKAVMYAYNPTVRCDNLVVTPGAPLAAAAGDYRELVMAYADAMIAFGRDRYGSEYSPLFASALHRGALNAMRRYEYPALESTREIDRTLTGANPDHDAELYQLLYLLTKLTGDSGYAEAADEALQWFFVHTQSPVTQLVTWGEHLGWDFFQEQPIQQPGNNEMHEPARWELWPESFAVARQACLDFALGMWYHQINDQVEGYFSRHARWDIHETARGAEYPRVGGMMIETWAYAYSNSTEPWYRNLMLTAMETLVDYYENSRNPTTDLIPAGSAGDNASAYWYDQELRLAVFAHNIADLLPEPTRTKVLTMCANSDNAILTRTNLQDYWYYERYLQTGLSAYANRLFMLADAYAVTLPNSSQLVYPYHYSGPLRVLIAAYRLSGNSFYFQAAKDYADAAIAVFLDETSPLPRVSNRQVHYESFKCGPELMYQLLQLYELERIAGDIAPEGGDGVVDTIDLAMLASQWLESGDLLCADIAPPEGDGRVDLGDLATMAENWLNQQ